MDFDIFYNEINQKRIINPIISPIYVTDCGTFTDVSGVIISPNYPNLYPNNRECIYKINRNEGERIQLKFNSFNVEASGCQYDYLEVG